MDDRRFSKQAIRRHLTYSLWKYVLVTICAVFGTSLLFDITEYRPPAEKKTDFYITVGYGDTEGLKARIWPLLKQACPEQEELNIVSMSLSDENMVGRMQFATYLGAGEGDLVLISRKEYQRLTDENGQQAVFADLAEYLKNGTIHADDEFAAEDGCYAVPAAGLSVLNDCGIHTAADDCLCIFAHSRNPDAAAVLIGILQDPFRKLSI